MTSIWQGRLVRLRAVEPSDWKTHYAWDHDSEMSRQIDAVWPPPSATRTQRWAEETAARSPTNDEFALEIETVEGNAFAGHIATHHCDRRVGSFFYGVATLPEHQRRGYASEAILLLARYFFSELRYQKINAQVYSFNVASLALHDKLGFTREGTLRRMVYTGGVFHDIIAFGMTVEEFAAHHPEMAQWRSS